MQLVDIETREIVPNPVIATGPLPDGGTARAYANGNWDAVDGEIYSISPGFTSFQELVSWIEEAS
jgi:hypothetical protein